MPPPQWQKQVAIIGSSGGGGSALGQGDIYGLLLALKHELERCEIGVAEIQIVDCQVPLDFANTTSPAVLWSLHPQTLQIERRVAGSLNVVNQQALVLDRSISRMVLGDEKIKIDGIISISADIDAVNRSTLMAAAKKGVPVVGTGGTSLGQAAGALGCLVVGNSGGSVATSVESKALSFTASLAAYWKLSYHPVAPKVHLHGVLGGCLPAFIAVMVANKVLMDVVGPMLAWWGKGKEGGTGGVADTMIKDLSFALPVIVAVLMASQVAKMGETALLAGALAGVLACCQGGGGGGGGDPSLREGGGDIQGGPSSTVLTGLLTGTLAGWLCRKILVLTAKSLFIPATASSIITAGVSGLLAAAVGGLVLHRPCLALSNFLHALLNYIEATNSASKRISFFHWVVGGILGGAMCWGSQVGYYHLIFLPLICFEMEHGQPSFFGAMDFCTLCLISGGLCAAMWLVPLPPYHPLARGVDVGVGVGGGGGGDPRPLAWRGLFQNVCFGDFVEACYPFFQGDWLLTGVVYVAACWSTVLLLHEGAKSTAYVPAPVSLWLAHTHTHTHMEGEGGGNGGGWGWMGGSKALGGAMVAFGLPFVVCLIRNVYVRVFG